jgi:mannitol-1-/sugar-/sorbitol-6-phosphatase
MGLVYRCRAVLLDMDGTLVDSTGAVEAQWGRWAERHGLRVEDVLKISHGRPALETMRILLPEVATAEEHERFVREEEEHESGSVAVRGAVRFVGSLPPERWGVVTSAPGNLALRRLRECGFPAPAVLIAPEHVRRGKPDPLPYRTAAARLGVAPEECLVVEDAPAGLRSAQAAGMTAIGITTTYTKAQLGAGVAVPDFEAIETERDGDTLLVRVLRPE